jgi:hypothetical protein
MSPSEDDYLDWERKQRILLPGKDANEYMIIPTREFRRLWQRIEEELPARHDGLPSAYFALFGAALATGVAIPSLMASQGLPSWTIPTFVVSASAFLVLGLVLVLVSRAVKKGRVNAASEIVREMREVEATYYGWGTRRSRGALSSMGSFGYRSKDIGPSGRC